jgi:hypothetical protein
LNDTWNEQFEQQGFVILDLISDAALARLAGVYGAAIEKPQELLVRGQTQVAHGIRGDVMRG